MLAAPGGLIAKTYNDELQGHCPFLRPFAEDLEGPRASGDGGGSRSYSRSQRPKAERAAREPELSVTRPVAQLSDKSRVNSSSYRNEALASHGGSQVLNGPAGYLLR